MKLLSLCNLIYDKMNPKPIFVLLLPKMPFYSPKRKNYSNISLPFDFPSNKWSLTNTRKKLGIRREFINKEIVLRFRIPSRKYHLNKWNTSVLYSKDIRIENFQIITNTRDLLFSYD